MSSEHIVVNKSFEEEVKEKCGFTWEADSLADGDVPPTPSTPVLQSHLSSHPPPSQKRKRRDYDDNMRRDVKRQRIADLERHCEDQSKSLREQVKINDSLLHYTKSLYEQIINLKRTVFTLAKHVERLGNPQGRSLACPIELDDDSSSYVE